jgi:hypothetical protein
MSRLLFIGMVGWLGLAVYGPAAEFNSLLADRAAIERIYHNHRIGERMPFQQAVPAATLEKLVRQELVKEAALKKVYGVTITETMLDVEVKRIKTTTRAPEMLSEIKAALNNDPAQFANSFAKPIVVERILRDKFNNDDFLHLPQRRQIEQTRRELLAAKTKGAGYEQLLGLLRQIHSNTVSEITWQLTARPATTNSPAGDEVEIKKRFGPNAQSLSSPPANGKEQRFCFEDLPPELQKVLHAQLRQSADVSAVIETPDGFLLYVTAEKTGTLLSVVALSLLKRSYEQWLVSLSQ